MERELKIRLAEDKAVSLDIKQAGVADFASVFLDDAVERVREQAAAHQITNVEMLAEGFLDTLNERITYFLDHVEAGERDVLLEWLVTGILGGYSQDFLRRYVSLLAQSPPGGEGKPGGEGGSG